MNYIKKNKDRCIHPRTRFPIPSTRFMQTNVPRNRTRTSYPIDLLSMQHWHGYLDYGKIGGKHQVCYEACHKFVNEPAKIGLTAKKLKLQVNLTIFFLRKKINWPADEGFQSYQPEAQSFLHDLEPKHKRNISICVHIQPKSLFLWLLSSLV